MIFHHAINFPATSGHFQRIEERSAAYITWAFIQGNKPLERRRTELIEIPQPCQYAITEKGHLESVHLWNVRTDTKNPQNRHVCSSPSYYFFQITLFGIQTSTYKFQECLKHPRVHRPSHPDVLLGSSSFSLRTETGGTSWRQVIQGWHDGKQTSVGKRNLNLTRCLFKRGPEWTMTSSKLAYAWVKRKPSICFFGNPRFHPKIVRFHRFHPASNQIISSNLVNWWCLFSPPEMLHKVGPKYIWVAPTKFRRWHNLGVTGDESKRIPKHTWVLWSLQ